MEHVGPPLADLMGHLAEAPGEFLAEPQVGALGEVHVAAVVADVLRVFGVSVREKDLAPLEGRHAKEDRAKLRLALLAAYVLSHPFYKSAQPPVKKEDLLNLFAKVIPESAPFHPEASRFVKDPERREELSRVVLAGLGFRPAGESKALAEDRLTGLSGAERAKVMAAAKAAEERASQIREALVRKAAEESADKYTRE